MDMENSPFETNQNHEDRKGSRGFQLIAQKRSSAEVEEVIEPDQPHKALFFVLAYLPLFELLSMIQVCRLLRDAVNHDVLLWLDIFVEKPLNLRISDNILMKITSKAHGRLRTLALYGCVRITDDGIQVVIENNPHINKLYVPACTGITPQGIVRAVKMLTDHNRDLKCLQIYGLYDIKKEHLESIYSCLQINPIQQKQQQASMFLAYRRISKLRQEDATQPIDIEICPKCTEIRLVFDCPRESCRRKREHPLTECRACYICIPRCEECGGCIDFEELEETACMDTLCSDCWLQLPKCNLCNKPYCNLHTDRQWIPPSSGHSTGFICDVCHMIYTENLAE
ncbi:hypothetical protein HHK36_014832 [Tetracentron sinense]|uniref:F-box domain-containing protein n=1 Tax=Tetracentron sinense TaxID=13715 RepID=A0A834Z3H8_TETSI|nr:hypothetical protein HHK36_014832 [Tetracentron sinense]